MSNRSSNQGQRGQSVYIIIALWIVLVIAGVFFTWYGWFAPAPAEPEPHLVPTFTPTPILTQQGQAAPVEETPTQSEQPETDATVLPTVPPASEPFGYGIATHGIIGDPNYTMGQVDSLGLGWVKQQIRWEDVERNPGEYTWGPYDGVVEAAHEKGLRVMLSVVNSPKWKRSYIDSNPEAAPPDNLAEYADFVGQIVERYQGRIHAIEVWNEQNLDREWDTAEGVDAEQYVEMLRMAYQAIKSRDPNIIVISGALSPVGVTCNEPYPECPPEGRPIIVDDFEYLDRMVDAGFLQYCDCVGAHHNGINMPPNVEWDEGYDDPTAEYRGPFDNPDHSWSFKSTLWGYHDRIAAAGSDKKLCVTEFGWATAEGFGDYPPGFEFALDNTLKEQAEWDVQAFQLMRQWGFVRLAFLWNLDFANKHQDPRDPNTPYSLLTFEGVARPAFGAIGAMEKP